MPRGCKERSGAIKTERERERERDKGRMKNRAIVGSIAITDPSANRTVNGSASCAEKLTAGTDKHKRLGTLGAQTMPETTTATGQQQALALLLTLTVALTLPVVVHSRQEYYYTYQDPYDDDLSLWINEQQVKIFSGVAMKIYAIDNGRVSPHIRDPNFSQYLPVIPSEVSCVNFTWRAGSKKYYYNFDRLMSVDENILKPPTISIKTTGRVPKNAKEFSVILPCSGNVSGIAMFSIGLLIQTRKGKPVPGTPLRIKLRKECAHRGVYERSSTLTSSSQGPDPECDRKCANKGVCNEDKICQCPEGYMGQYCQTALCYPQCMNGGNCTAPGTCSCPPGYQGRHCEGGICAEKCLNGGKCIQKDKCECTKGYYGLRCEYSKCVIPCLHDGKCRGVNKCRCKPGLSGDHCQIGRRQRSTCKRPCKHGLCQPNHTCACDSGWYGRLCNQREKKRRNINGVGGDAGRLPKK